MRKLYILDTSVLIDDPGAFKSYKDSEVIIPIAVINELDSKKHYLGESGKNARVCIKMLDEISSIGDINTGVLLDNETLIKVDVEYRKISDKSVYSGFGDPKYTDTHILACAYDYDRDSEYDDVTLVTNDFNLRIKAKARGINSEGHSAKFSLSDLYAGSQVIVNERAAFELQQESFIDPNLYNIDMNLHECVLFTDNDENGLAMGRKVNENKIKLIRKNYPWGIKSRNKEQTFAIDLMLDKGIDLVTLIGKSGTGKTLIALSCALEQVINNHEYEKLIIYRPIQAVSSDIGYLPGTEEEKLAPWFQAVMDSFEYLFKTKHGDWRKDLEMYKRKGRIEFGAITYIRGRSLPKSIILIDESQNISKEDIKTMLTRAGEGTKIVLTGDIEQIDNAGLDATSNGLSYVIEKFKNKPLSGHITFTQGERSRLATLASEIL